MTTLGVKFIAVSYMICPHFGIRLGGRVLGIMSLLCSFLVRPDRKSVV